MQHVPINATVVNVALRSETKFSNFFYLHIPNRCHYIANK